MQSQQISALTVDTLGKIYNSVLKDSSTFIFYDSKVNQLLDAKGDRKVVLEMDMSPAIKDNDLNLLSLQMGCGAKAIKKIGDIKGDDIVISADQKSYYFSNQFFNIEVPRLNNYQIDAYRYDLDYFNHYYIDYCDTSTQTINSNTYNFCINHFNKQNPVDILIANNSIIGFAQENKIFSPNLIDNKKASIYRSDAEIILRSYNFPYPRKGIHDTLTRVKRNGDGLYWLALEAKTSFSGIVANFYEHLEKIR